MIAVTVHRPTEDLAVGQADRRPIPARTGKQLMRLIAWAQRVGDRYGEELFRARLLRPAGAGRVGE
ncbi:hypothetical protein AB0D10_05315 [Kitasatospora sp. NPDC048545]|uniref:hypothetical protein n=1 Tax=Kitasatospora sp. NPDC048545 TaxID=3157208 RepID=UPI0033F5C67E